MSLPDSVRKVGGGERDAGGRVAVGASPFAQMPAGGLVPAGFVDAPA